MSRQLTWDAEIDTPATVAVIGGGAIGVEAALYARFLGYYVLLIEAAKMAQSWRTGVHLPMLTPFGQAASPLGMAALEAHRPDTPLPELDAKLTGLEFAEKYLVPLARTDLLYDSVQVHSRVMSVSRIETRRESPGDIQDRADIEYRLAVHSKNRGWYSERADIVLDCSGVGIPRWMGPGGGMAMGQVEQTYLIDTGLPDVCCKQRSTYANQRVLLVGVTLQAVQNLLSLIELVRAEPGTKVTWLVLLDQGMRSASDWLERIAALGTAGQELAARPEVRQALKGDLPGLVVLEGVGIERMAPKPDGLNVCIQSDEINTLDIVCDRIISSVGYQPDWEHTRALRVGESTVLARPVFHQATTSEADEQAESADALDIAASIVTSEPHYYILGSKSFGLAHERFTLAQGHQQIREAFTIIGGRADLDLYTNIQR